MNIMTIDVQPLADTLADVADAMETLQVSGPRISFATPDLLWKVLTAKRWEILRVMTGAGALSLLEVAQRVSLDINEVQGDVRTLLESGLIDKSADDRVIFPYDAVHVDFIMKAA